MQIELKLKLGFGVALLLLAGTAAIPFYTSWSTNELQAQLNRTQQRVELLENVLSLMKDVETGSRGFALTGNDMFLEPYHEGLVKLRPARAQLQDLRQAAPAYPPMIDRLEELIRLRLEQSAQTISLRRGQGIEAAAGVVRTGRGKQYMDGIRIVVAELARSEDQRRVTLQAEVDRRVDLDTYVGLGASLVDLALFGLLMFLQFRLMRQRQAVATELGRTTEQLNRSLAEQERRHAEVQLIGQMARALESPNSLKETFETIAVYGAKLLPATAGAVYMFRNSRDLLLKESEWGDPVGMIDSMAPEDCWALRRGQLHRMSGPHDLVCPHWREASHLPDGAMCVPLIAQGEVLGLICLERRHGAEGVDPMDATQQALALAASEQIALTLSNVRLREVLRQQSVADPLTGLFNRRYMDETLRRELARAMRKNMPLSVMVLDVDHFKRVNDVFGHEGGDMVLRAVAQQLREVVRESDVACRLGGEEFLLILPECTKQAAAARAEDMAKHLRQLRLQYSGQQIGAVTASFGVATYPDDGLDGPALIKAADRAMYQAKGAGRDRVMLAAA